MQTLSKDVALPLTDSKDLNQCVSTARRVCCKNILNSTLNKIKNGNEFLCCKIKIAMLH